MGGQEETQVNDFFTVSPGPALFSSATLMLTLEPTLDLVSDVLLKPLEEEL